MYVYVYMYIHVCIIIIICVSVCRSGGGVSAILQPHPVQFSVSRRDERNSGDQRPETSHSGTLEQE